jgi:rod shape-determining protein MreC
VTLLVLVSITVLVLGSTSPFAGVRSRVSDAFGPVRRAGKSVTSPFGDVFGSATRYKKVRKENETLRAELAAAQGKAAEAQDAIRERSELLAAAKLEDVETIKSVNARVTGQPLGNFDSTIEIDRGSDSGIRRGMPVRTGAGLVGRVTYVTAKQARVLLITDEQARVGVRLSTSGEVGLAVGGGSSKNLQVDLIDPNTVIADSEVLVTSGLQNTRFPAGIPVGIVASHKVGDGSLQQEVMMQPLADVSHLTFVVVLLWDPPVSLPPTPTIALVTTTVAGAVPAIEPNAPTTTVVR